MKNINYDCKKKSYEKGEKVTLIYDKIINKNINIPAYDKLKISLYGGSGGGGGAIYDQLRTNSAGGGGGGNGETKMIKFNKSLCGINITLNVGRGGQGGIGNFIGLATSGENGGDTYICFNGKK